MGRLYDAASPSMPLNGCNRTWRGRNGMAPQFTIHERSKASPEQIYDLLANPSSHLVWNGTDQASNLRLLTVRSESAPATVGSIFVSTGTIPFSSRTWEDRSTLTEADRPHVFEFQTEGTVAFQNGDHMEATFLHRYVIESALNGS